MIVAIYYLPIWFQVIDGVSAVESGIRNLPLILSLVAASLVSGVAITITGYYTPFMILGTILMSIGGGLLTSFQPDTGPAKWIGYQLLIGIGLGLGLQQPNLAAQTVLPRHDVAYGASLMFFSQGLGGAVFLSIAQNVFTNTLVTGLSKIPGLNSVNVASIGATEISSIVAPGDLGTFLVAYNFALMSAFDVALAMACFSAVGALAMEWVSVKGKKHGGGTADIPQQTTE